MGTFEQINAAEGTLRSAREAGQLVLAHSGDVHKEYTIVGSGYATKHIAMTIHPLRSMLGDMLPEFDITTTDGLRIVGNTRRQGLLRRFIGMPLDDYRKGDRLMLEYEDGARATTRRINAINPIDEYI
jgi:hypothetical protein